MKHLAKAAALAALATACLAGAAPLSAWHGRYVWEESLGRIGGDDPAESVAIFITYTLALGPGAGATGCRLDAEGYQTNRHLRCTATPEGQRLIVKYYAPAADDMGRPFTTGQRLLALDRSGGSLTTRLEALQPASDASPRAGRLFREAR